MRDDLERLKRWLDEAFTLPGTELTEAVIDGVRSIDDGVYAAMEDIVRAVAEGAPAPIAELEALQEAFEARRRALRSPLGKVLYRAREILKAGIERAAFAERSRGVSATCGCVTWRAVAKGRGLSAVPSLPASRVVEDVDDVFERYRVHECGACRSRWLEDFNPDSDPSVTRWWAKA